MFDEFCAWALEKELDLEEDDEHEIAEASTYVPDEGKEVRIFFP